MQESELLSQINTRLQETNRLLRLAFADKLGKVIEEAVQKTLSSDDKLSIAILRHLISRSQAAEELTNDLGALEGVSRRTIQRRLERLMEAGLVHMQRQGGRVEYALDLERLIEI